TREYELDQLLRNEVFVDLYRVVRQGLIVGEPRYSIKNIELLYRGKRETEVSGGGESIVVYENWREAFAAGEEGGCWQSSETLKQIRDYNIDDCNSTQELVDWLRARQLEANIPYVGGAAEVIVAEPKEEQLAVQILRDRLMKKSDALLETDPDEAALWQTLGGVLEFHWREAKPGFWRLFDRLGADPAELADDSDCLADCVRTEAPPFKDKPSARNLTYEYRFDAGQEFRGAGKTFQIAGYETEDGKSLKVDLIADSSDLENGLVALKCRQEPPDFLSLVLSDFINPAPIPKAIAAVVTDIEAGSGSHGAVLSLLRRDKPTFDESFMRQLAQRSDAIAPSKCPTEKLRQITDAVNSLQQSCLVIQGPPGTGKTYTASCVIGKLLKDGHKVGVASNSHAAINNLLLATAGYCSEVSVDAAITCTKYTEEGMEEAGVMQCANAVLANNVQPGSLVGTTAWGFSRDDMANTLDYLFVDEAGQVALANVIGMSRAADNLVLLGDQMQLGQPTQGTHPGKSGSSVLEYMMGEQATIAEDEGVFLGAGFRMHSAVNQFISKQFYDGRLQSRPDNDERRLLLDAALHSELSDTGAGVFFIPVTHDGNTQSSVEEAQLIAELVSGLLRGELRVKDGCPRPLVMDDILFVAPYNQQVRVLKDTLGPDARVGSVDKFQGQEAAVVFLSLCASDASESPRGLGFLLDRHRINVAVSRAQSMVIIVGHPELVSGPVDTMAALAQANLFAALVEQSYRQGEISIV
ncbi:MAG: AAA domain-containing protein, partial [Granulosicoccus sp.]